MKIINNIFNKTMDITEGMVAIGYFDAIHLGHKKILNELLKKSKENKLNHFVLTYKNIPFKDKNKKIIDLDDKLKYLKELGIKNIILCDFDKIKNLSPEKFVKILKTNFNINTYLIGEDFKFGYNKTGNIDTLKKLNCNVETIKPLYAKNIKISTSYIKELLSKGKITIVNKLLDKPFYIKGIVKKGKQLGRKIGFPTMNINNSEIFYPENGVYITKTTVKNEEYKSMTYVEFPVIESYLMNFNKFKYNFKIKVDFFAKIRDNKIFKNHDELILQLNKDLTKIKDYFNIAGDF